MWSLKFPLAPNLLENVINNKTWSLDWNLNSADYALSSEMICEGMEVFLIDACLMVFY